MIILYIFDLKYIILFRFVWNLTNLFSSVLGQRKQENRENLCNWETQWKAGGEKEQEEVQQNEEEIIVTFKIKKMNTILWTHLSNR